MLVTITPVYQQQAGQAPSSPSLLSSLTYCKACGLKYCDVPDPHCLSKVQFQELNRLLLLCQLAYLGVLNTGIFGPCLVAALRTGGLLETPPPWHGTILLALPRVLTIFTWDSPSSLQARVYQMKKACSRCWSQSLRCISNRRDQPHPLPLSPSLA